MSAAELAARRTAAQAVLGDYRRGAGDLDMIDRAVWAARLADALGGVLDQLDAEEGAG